jgi:hypothetical protein
MRILFFLIFLFLSISFGKAQDTIVPTQPEVVRFDTDSEVSPMEFSEERIESFKADEDFNYTEIQPDEDNWWEKFKRWLSDLWYRFWDWLLPDYASSPFWSFIVSILPYLIILSIIVFIVWLFYRLNPGAKILKSQDAPDVFFTEEEEIIKTKDIQKLIEQALENQDYRLAVRYSYLLILKRLSNAHVIEYEFDKTNSDYIAEITSENINDQFKKVTTLYDYIWYGSFSVTQADYQIAQKTFNRLKTQIPEALD